MQHISLCIPKHNPVVILHKAWQLQIFKKMAVATRPGYYNDIDLNFIKNIEIFLLLLLFLRLNLCYHAVSDQTFLNCIGNI